MTALLPIVEFVQAISPSLTTPLPNPWDELTSKEAPARASRRSMRVEIAAYDERGRLLK
ncbi:hypothetical protein ACRAVF_19120 [Bradyrhizobium oligotrophicum S58]